MTDLVEKWKEAARRDDLFNHMVPSDVRQLIGAIERLRASNAELVEALETTLGFAQALEKRSGMGTGSRRGGAVFAKARAAIERAAK